jgi:hypothetical protein
MQRMCVTSRPGLASKHSRSTAENQGERAARYETKTEIQHIIVNLPIKPCGVELFANSHGLLAREDGHCSSANDRILTRGHQCDRKGM